MAEGTELDYQLLGHMALWVGGEQRTASQAKPRGVLALLLLNLNRPVSTDQLIELLWPDKPPGRPQTAIQGYVSGPVDARLDFRPPLAKLPRKPGVAAFLEPRARVDDLRLLSHPGFDGDFRPLHYRSIAKETHDPSHISPDPLLRGEEVAIVLA